MAAAEARRSIEPCPARGVPPTQRPALRDDHKAVGIQVFHSSSRSRRTAALAGFFDLSHVFDGPLR